MLYLLDGSNILGRLGLNRIEADSQRRLLRAAAALSREKRARVVCFFDGAAQESLPSSLGAVAVRFSGKRPADEVIVEEARSHERQPVRVITDDRELGARVKRRNVEILAAGELRPFLDAEPAQNAPAGEDWESYFSDPKNRNV